MENKKFATAYDPNDSSKYYQEWNKEKIEITKAGVKFNVYDAIQAAAEDTDIYEVLEKYNCLTPITRSTEAVYGDFRNALTLKNICDQQIEIQNIFDTLPIEEKALFGNDVKNYIENGEKYYIEKLKKEKQTEITEPKPEVKADEQK